MDPKTDGKYENTFVAFMQIEITRGMIVDL